MITMRPFFGQAQVCFILFASFALAALQNITVDDAASTGTVVPTYLPSPSNWNLGNNCLGCLVKPDPSMAYDGTWHDTTFSPNSTVSQAFEFTFVGSGLYIFFILANNVPYATTLTNVNFILDGVQASSFLHNPSTSTNYVYNQVVYANNAIPFGQHTMKVAPVNDAVNNVLILFDYLIYTTDTATSSVAFTSTTDTSSVVPTITTGKSSAVPTLTTDTSSVYLTLITETLASGIITTSAVFQTPSPSPTSTGNPTTSSGQNIGAVVGGIVAGVGTIVLVIVSLLCYRRYKRRTGGQSSSAGVTMVEPFVLSRQIPPPSSEDTSLPNQQMPMGFPPTEPGSRGKSTASPVTVQPSNPASTVTPSSSGASSGGAAEIIEQVGLLRDEVARLRRLQDHGWNIPELESVPPPEYS